MTGQSQSDKWVCSVCGSFRLKYIEGESPTGVVAPDGGEERRAWEAVRCLDCGTVEEL